MVCKANRNQLLTTGIRTIRTRRELRDLPDTMKLNGSAKQYSREPSKQGCGLHRGPLKGSLDHCYMWALAASKAGVSTVEFLMRRVKYRSQLPAYKQKTHLGLTIDVFSHTQRITLPNSNETNHQRTPADPNRDPATVNHCRFIPSLFIDPGQSLLSPSTQHPEPGHNHQSAQCKVLQEGRCPKYPPSSWP